MPYEEIFFSAYFYTKEHICQYQDAVSLINNRVTTGEKKEILPVSSCGFDEPSISSGF